MQNTFPTALKHILKYEGGYTDHPLDPGGATNMGITHRTLANFRGKSVSHKDVKQLTLAEVSDIYKKFYWQPCHCDELPVGLDLAVFDCAVNQGVSRAIKFLQKSLRVKTDGIIGPITLRAANSTSPETLLTEFIARRMNHYGRLSTLFMTFGLGWSRRLSDVHAQSLYLLKQHGELS